MNVAPWLMLSSGGPSAISTPIDHPARLARSAACRRGRRRILETAEPATRTRAPASTTRRRRLGMDAAVHLELAGGADAIRIRREPHPLPELRDRLERPVKVDPRLRRAP